MNPSLNSECSSSTFSLRLVEQLVLRLRHDDVADRHRRTRLRRVPEAQRLDRVEELRRGGVAELAVALRDELLERVLVERRVEERVLPLRRERFVEHDAPDRGLHARAVDAHFDPLVQTDQVVVERRDRFGAVFERHVARRAVGLVRTALAVAQHRRRVECVVRQRRLRGPLVLVGVEREPVQTEDHVLGRDRHRVSERRLQDVVRRQHQDARFRLRTGAQRKVNGHLVAVEVGVVRRADQRVQMDGFAFHQHGLERLDAETVQRRCAVEQHGVLANHFVENVPHFRTHAFHHALRALDVVRLTAVDELLHHERLEELERHFLRQAALVQLEVRADDDDRTARVVDALAEQVLAEASLLAFENVGQRFQRAVVGPGDRTAAAAVVDQRVDCFLQHALFVLDDDLGRAQFQQPLEAVVAVDDAAVEIVQIRRRETAAVELHHRAQFGRDHGDGGQDHPLRLVAGREERFDHFEALDRFDALLARRLFELAAQIFLELAQVQIAQQLADRFRAHARLEARAVLLAALAVLLLGEDLALRQRRVTGIGDDVRGEIDHLLELARRHVEQDADARRHALEIPNVRDGRGQLDVAHALAAHFGARDLDAAAVADHPLEADALVLAAVAFPVFGGPEDLLAEKTVALGLQRAVVDRLRLFDFAERPRTNLFRRREANAHRVEVVDV